MDDCSSPLATVLYHHICKDRQTEYFIKYFIILFRKPHVDNLATWQRLLTSLSKPTKKKKAGPVLLLL